MNMYLPSYLKKELESKRKAISRFPEKRLAISKAIEKNKKKEALIHTARGELPIASIHYIPGFKKKKEFKKILTNVENAWNYGLVAYADGLDSDFLKQLAWNLAPDFFQGDTAFFRRPGSVNTIVAAWEHVPPRPERIEDELYIHITSNPDIEQMSPVEAAVYLNLHLARIQAFPDCNKRTGKLVQNLHLVSQGYPPATVHEGEVEYYNHLMGEAVKGFKGRQGNGRASKSEKGFFEYMGTRVNNSLDDMLDVDESLPPQMKSKGMKRFYKVRRH
jgi:hypothetical protein